MVRGPGDQNKMVLNRSGRSGTQSRPGDIMAAICSRWRGRAPIPIYQQAIVSESREAPKTRPYVIQIAGNFSPVAKRRAETPGNHGRRRHRDDLSHVFFLLQVLMAADCPPAWLPCLPAARLIDLSHQIKIRPDASSFPALQHSFRLELSPTCTSMNYEFITYLFLNVFILFLLSSSYLLSMEMSRFF